MYKNSVSQVLRSDINKHDANQFMIGTVLAVNSETRMATIYIGNQTNKLSNIIILDDVNIADIKVDSDALILKMTSGLYILMGTLSTRVGKSIELNNFDGGIKIGKKNAHLPKSSFYLPTDVSSYEIYETITSDTYGYDTYTYTYSYSYNEEEVVLAEDVYAGEIRRFGNKVYSWCSTYDAPNSTYDFPAEWVAFDDARFIRGVPVSFESPDDGQVLSFNQAYGMYRPTEISGSSSPAYTNKWFVSEDIGDDDNDGTSEATAFATIDKAIESCSANGVVYVLDSNTYTVSSPIIVPDTVTINMPFAKFEGELILGTSSRFIAKSHYPSANNQTMVSCIGTAGSAYTVYGMSSVGYTDIIHFKPAAVGGYVVAQCRHITVGSSTSGHENILVYSTAGSTGVNVATDPAKFSSDKAINYGTAADLVYGDTGYCQWYTDIVGLPVTITYDIGTGTTVSSYKMKATSSGTRMPKNWTLHGQLSGGGWAELDSQTGILWSSYEEKEFTISSPGSYDEYKITVTLSEHATRLQIDDIGLLAGVASVGGDVMITADILSLGEYAQGVLSHDSAQRVITNFNNIYPISGAGNATFIVISAGNVSHTGEIATAATLWTKTGGTLLWSVTFDTGTKTGSADYYHLRNTDTVSILGNHDHSGDAGDGGQLEADEALLSTGIAYGFVPVAQGDNSVEWQAAGAAVVPAGADTQVQFNDEGALGGDAGLTFAKATDILSVVGGVDLGATLYSSREIAVDTGGVLNVSIGSAAGDDFTIDTNKLVVEGDTGNVGIGTTGPGAKLEISGGDLIVNSTTAGSRIYGVTTANSYIEMYSWANGDMTFYGTFAQGDINFNTANSATPKVKIQYDGNVGIGTTAPTAVLHLKAGSATANTAPLQFTAGPVETTPRAGLVEFDGTDFYVTF